MNKDQAPRTFGPAFTLIELLVVIAVIALLISLILPALAGARESARNVVDASDLRQMAVAVSVYAKDYKDYLPPGDAPAGGGNTLVWIYDPPAGTGGISTWDVLMNSYDVPATSFGCNSFDWIKDRWNDIGLYVRQLPGNSSNPYTKMGWNYFANRTFRITYDQPGGSRVYKYARKQSDAEQASSDTLLTCANWNAMLPSPQASWRTFMPHDKRNHCKLWEAGTPASQWRAPDGINSARFDASVRFVPVGTLKAAGQSDWYYFEPRGK
jgi:prepilin-type N-terminal cleavage/methylation domain-containing protein